MHNNIFPYATSELSQDAMLCWLLSWSEQRNASIDPQLHAAGKAFLDSLLAKWNYNIEQVKKISIQRQTYGIDVIADINDTHLLVIEDKTGTKTHSGQLERYKQSIEADENYKQSKIAYIYFKTYDFCPEDALKKSEFRVYERQDLLNYFQTIGQSQNYLLQSFHDYVYDIEENTASYKTTPTTKWSWNACKGFYTYLRLRYPEMGCEYVPNPRGGFLGCWWHWGGFMESSVYLQLETTFSEQVKTRLCFKIGEIESDDPKSVRNAWRDKLKATAALENIPLKFPRLGTGKWMTVAEWDSDCRITDNHGLILLPETLVVLDKAAQLLDKAQI